MAHSPEERALVAVMDGDQEESRAILEDFYPSELETFADHLATLAGMVDEVRRGKSAR